MNEWNKPLLCQTASVRNPFINIKTAQAADDKTQTIATKPNMRIRAGGFTKQGRGVLFAEHL